MVPPARRDEKHVQREDAGGAGTGSLPERAAALCDRPSLSAILTRLRASEGEGGCVVVDVEASRRGLVESNLVEIKALFGRVLNRSDVEVVLREPEAGNEGPEARVVRTSVDAEFEHPLVKSVAEFLDAQPRRVEPRAPRS